MSTREERPRALVIELRDEAGAIGLDDALEDAARALGKGPLGVAIRDARDALARTRTTARALEGHVTPLETLSDDLDAGVEVEAELDMFPYALSLHVSLDWLRTQRGRRLRRVVRHLDGVLELVGSIEGSTLTIELDGRAVTADAARRVLLEHGRAPDASAGTLALPGLEDHEDDEGDEDE